MAFKKYVFNPIRELDLIIPKSARREALEEAASLLKETMLSYIAEGKSPVAGGKWVKKLSTSYLSGVKSNESTVRFANLELSGEFLDSLTVEVQGNNIVIDVGDDKRGMAEGHVTGVYGANSKKVTPRQFAPTKGETFKSAILSDLKKIMAEFED